LQNSKLDKAEFGRAIFVGANLDKATLTYSYLARANFNNASVNEVDFTGAYLYLAKLAAVDLSRSIGLTRDQLNLACGDDNTKLPSSIDTRPDWRCID